LKIAKNQRELIIILMIILFIGSIIINQNKFDSVRSKLENRNDEGVPSMKISTIVDYWHYDSIMEPFAEFFLDDTYDHYNPAFVDLDNDSMEEFVIGFMGTVQYISLKNYGTRKNPVWKQVNYLRGITNDSNGFAFTFGDLDGDSLNDCMIGAYYGEFYAYRNNGTATQPSWERMPDWEKYFPVDFGSHVRPVLVDIDNDSDYDCMVSYYITYDNCKIDLYINNGSKDNGSWEYGGNIVSFTDELDQEPKIDMADIDDDGDQDMIIGFATCQSYVGWGYEFKSNFKLLENIGNSTNYNFTWANGLVSNMYVGESGSPEFIDWDKDGDYDIVAGDHKYIYYFENTNNKTDPVWSRNGPGLIDKGIYPGNFPMDIVDINFDGRKDMIVFKEVTALGTSVIQVYMNYGTNSTPFYVRDPSYQITQYSLQKSIYSFLEGTAGDIDNDHKIEIICRYMENSTSTKWALIENNGTNSNPKWILNDTFFQSYNIIGYAPEMVDLNYDNLLDFVTINDNGSINYYQNIGTVTTPSWAINASYFSGSYVPSSPTDISFGDLDYDAQLDFVVVNDNIHRVYENNGTIVKPDWVLNYTIFCTSPSDLNYRKYIDLSDLNKDGYIDFIGDRSDNNMYYELYYSSPNRITIVPLNEQGLGYNSNPTLNISFYAEGGVDDGYYRLDRLPWKIIFENSTQIDESIYQTILNSTEWDNLDEGVMYSMYFGVTDDNGVFDGDNLNRYYQFYKDITPPYISNASLNQMNNSIFNSGTDQINIEILDVYSNIGYCYSQLNDTGWVQFKDYISGSKSYNEWKTINELIVPSFDTISEGMHRLYFWITDKPNNSKGSDMSLYVDIYKDSIDPVMYQEPGTKIPQTINETKKVWVNGTAADNGSLIYNSGVDQISIVAENATGVSWVNSGNETNWSFYNTTNIPDGKYFLIIQAIDKAGNVKNLTCNFTVDTKNPYADQSNATISPQRPINGKIWINGTAGDDGSGLKSIVKVSWNATGVSWSFNQGTLYNWSFYNTSHINDGDYYMNLNFSDNANFSILYVCNFTVDTISPKITIHSPLNKTVYRDSVLINVSVSDKHLNTTKFYYYDNGWILFGENQSKSQYITFIWNLTGIDIDNTTILINASDVAGNVGTNISINSISLDGTPPNITLVSPINNEKITSLNYIINVTTNSEDICNITYYYHNGTAWNYIGINNSKYNKEFTFNWNVTGLDLENVTILVNATDHLNYNTVYQTSATISVDNIFPTGVIINPNSDTNITGVYTLNCTVDNNDIMYVEFYYHNGTGWTLIGVNSTHPYNHVFTYQFNTLGIDLNSSVLMFNITDDVGNVLSINTTGLYIKIDGVIPTINTIVYPRNNAKITGLYTIYVGIYHQDIILVEFYYFDSGWVLIGVNDTYGLYEYKCIWNTTGLDLVNTQVQIVAYDDCGNVGTNSTTASIEVDNTPPEINLINPSTNEFIESMYLLTANTTHPDIQMVVFFYFDTSWHSIGVNNTNPNGSSFTYMWDTTALNLYNITIKVNATDDVGLMGSDTTKSVSVDNAPPIGFQDMWDLQYGKDIWINGTASDLVGLNSVEFYPESPATTNFTGITWSANLGNNTNWAFRNLTTIADGLWWIILNISDISGKYINVTCYVWVDNYNPILSQDSSTRNQIQNIKPYWVNGTYNDGTTAKNITVISTNGTSITWSGGMVNRTYWAFYSNDNISDGIYNVSIKVFDKTYKSTILHCIIKLDFTFPMITFDGPIQNNTLSDKPKTLNFTVNDRFLDYVQWRSSITNWATNFIGTFDINLSSFSCNTEYDFEIRAFDTSGHQNTTRLKILFNKRTIVKGNTIINATIDGIWIYIQTSQIGYVEIEKLTYNPFSEYSLPGLSVNIFYLISTNLTTFICEIRIYLNDTTNLNMFYWDNINLQWHGYTQSGSRNLKSPDSYLWAYTNKLGYIAALRIPSGGINTDNSWIFILLLIIVIGGISGASVYIFSKKRAKTTIETTYKPKSKPKGGLKRDMEMDIKVLRGGEIKGKSYIFKVKVINTSEFNLTDITIQIVSYPYDCLKLTSKESQKINKLDAGGFVSPTFTFLPTHDCVKGKILANVSFVDIFNHLHMVEVQPHDISMVCGLFRPIKISNEDFSKITSGILDFAKAGDEFNISYNPKLIFTKLKILLPDNNFEIINEEKKEIGDIFFGIIRGFAEGKFSKKKIGVEITISGNKDEDESICKIEAFSEDQFVLPPLISELNEELQTWTCTTCNKPLTEQQVQQLLAGKPITCNSCKNVMTKMISETSPHIEMFESIRRELSELKSGQEKIIATQELTLEKIEDINDYVLDIMKLIPIPSKIESTGKLRKNIKVYFSCPIDDELIGSFEEKAWAGWVKYISAIGQAALDYITGISISKDLINSTKSVYSQLSGGKPLPEEVIMLTTQERENLRKILTKAGIMDKIRYCAKCKRWVCLKHYTDKKCCENCSL